MATMERSYIPRETKPRFISDETNQLLLELLFMITLMFMFENLTALANIRGDARSQALSVITVVVSIFSMAKFGLLISNGRQELATMKQAKESEEVLVVENSTHRTQRSQRSRRKQPTQEKSIENWPEIVKFIIHGCDNVKEINTHTIAYFMIKCVIVPLHYIRTYLPIVLGTLIKGMKYFSNQVDKGLVKIYRRLRPSLVRFCELEREKSSIPTFLTTTLSNFLDLTADFVDGVGPTGASRPDQVNTGTVAMASSPTRQQNTASNTSSTGKRQRYFQRSTGGTHPQSRSPNMPRRTTSRSTRHHHRGNINTRQQQQRESQSSAEVSDLSTQLTNENILSTSPTGPTRQRHAAAKRRRRNLRRRTAKQNRGNAENEDATSEKPLEKNICLFLGRDVMESNLASNAGGEEDSCPCCLKRFQIELESDQIAVLPCQHGCCLPCLSSFSKVSRKKHSEVSFGCPLCRTPLSHKSIRELTSIIIDQTPALKERFGQMHLSYEDCLQICCQLLNYHDFNIVKVLQSLDSMLVDNLQTSLRRVNSLTVKQKHQVYDEARRPVEVLFKEVRDLRQKLRNISSEANYSYISSKRRIDTLQEDLIPKAMKNAQNYIWNAMNSAGEMARDSDDGIVLDFHGLHVEEAKNKFDDEVVPILPVIKKIRLIVGRGKHSSAQIARLKPMLQEHIAEHPRHHLMTCRVDPTNDGALFVYYKH
uniref:RING-type domain-containing protein n=1 Tax=Chaetoceros debilis TaxID=122233 RepID=A0A7S3V5Q9_9STRA